MPTNRAAYLNSVGTSLTVSDAPFTQPGEKEILVRNHAVAINPVDWMMRGEGHFVQTYPTILGCDVAGTVESVGPGVSAFAKGDRVFGHSLSIGTGKTATAAFQEYVVLELPVVAKIPDSLTFEQASVLPLALNTASAGLYEDDKLALSLPPSTDGKGKSLLVWGGSSSVGATTIQLAAASGYNVVATASKRNHDLVLSLGASRAFDYNDAGLVDDVVAALKGTEVVGAFDSISKEDTIKSVCTILAKSGGRKMVASTLPGSDGYAIENVTVKPVFGITPASNGIGAHVWGKYLYNALKDGSFQAKPDVTEGGKGLESLDAAVSMQQKGVSGKKIVVSL